MYNSIYPVNINYTKQNKYYQKTDNTQNSPANSSSENTSSNTFPNGTKVAIDYSKGQINISQVLTDFRSTIVAINAPEDVKNEVYLYLNLVEKEATKENPTKDIILSNLKNAAKVSDSFIADSLKKPSNVVEGWIDALFLQKINLKADPSEINPDFLLEFPKNAQERIDNSKLAEQQIQPVEEEKEPLTAIEQEEPLPIEEEQAVKEVDNTPFQVESEIELSQQPILSADTPFTPVSDSDTKAYQVLHQIKQFEKNDENDAIALGMLNETLGELQDSDDSNVNIKAALHFERAQIFNNYDYVDYALRDYWEATKADELNLKANAFYKSGSIYDEFNEFDPAISGYLSSVAYSGEADNQQAQALVLSKIASLYAKQYDSTMTQEYDSLAQDSANSTNNTGLIAKTHSSAAQNLQYLGENDKAIDSYRAAIEAFSRTDESYEDMAYNYEQAALVMRKLGNSAKADKLQQKAQLYYQKAQLESDPLAKVS